MALWLGYVFEAGGAARRRYPHPRPYFEANVTNDELVLVRVDGGAVDLDA